ncbi:hypothetical protein SE948_15535 [Legionella pneumophila]|nr:hypothetical protein [Legionella pneumophila]
MLIQLSINGHKLNPFVEKLTVPLMNFFNPIANNHFIMRWLYKEGSIIYKIEIFDKEKIASSTHTQCTLNTEHHDVFMNYDFHYLDDHGDCIREILDACNKLKINSLHMDDE